MLWNNPPIFQPASVVDLQYKHLPPGQLAETQVTQFDDRGSPSPIGATIYLDPKAE
jgi:hypothetical protein